MPKFFTAAALVDQLEEAQKQYVLEKLLKRLDKVNLLIVDELGYLSFSLTYCSGVNDDRLRHRRCQPSTVYRILKDAGRIGRANNKPSLKGIGFVQPTTLMPT